MPHLTIEYSRGLEADADIGLLCSRLKQVIVETGVFELGAVRVRAFAANHAAIADELEENDFLDMSLRIGTGRPPDEKRRVGEALFAATSQHLADRFTTPHFALSLEIREIDADLSWKKNAIHLRIRASLEAQS